MQMYFVMTNGNWLITLMGKLYGSPCCDWTALPDIRIGSTCNTIQCGSILDKPAFVSTEQNVAFTVNLQSRCYRGIIARYHLLYKTQCRIWWPIYWKGAFICHLPLNSLIHFQVLCHFSDDFFVSISHDAHPYDDAVNSRSCSTSALVSPRMWRESRSLLCFHLYELSMQKVWGNLW